MSDRTFKISIPLGKSDRRTIFSKDCHINLPTGSQPLHAELRHVSQPLENSLVGKWIAHRLPDEVVIDGYIFDTDELLPSRIAQAFHTLAPGTALEYPYSFKPTKWHVDDDGIIHYDEIELLSVTVGVKAAPPVEGVIKVKNGDIQNNPFGPVPIRELTKDLEVTEELETVEGSFNAKNIISPTFEEHKLTARRVPTCDICGCLLPFHRFEVERCEPCENCLQIIAEVLNDHEAKLRGATIEEVAESILKAITPVGLLHHGSEEE